LVKRLWFAPILILILLVGGFVAWQYLKPPGLPAGIAAANGRIEGTEIDIDTKLPGRIADILVDEGDFVRAGQVLVHMDTKTLEAQRREAVADLERATIGVQTAESVVKEREAERAAAIAKVGVTDWALDAATRRFARSSPLAREGWATWQAYDNDRAAMYAATAAGQAAKAGVAASEAALGAAKSQVVDAKARVEAAKATIQRIVADINDSTLRTPRDGRVQYKVAEQGEVLPAGGRVLNLVDLSDVYMTCYLPTDEAGRLAIGAEARIVLDAFPQDVIPAYISYVADVAQFTPKTVETAVERQKLMFRIKVQIPAALLRKYIRLVKTGLPGMAYVKMGPTAQWPAFEGTLLK
jgi:HlyD family secretion protein